MCELGSDSGRRPLGAAQLPRLEGGGDPAGAPDGLTSVEGSTLSRIMSRNGRSLLLLSQLCRASLSPLALRALEGPRLLLTLEGDPHLACQASLGLGAGSRPLALSLAHSRKAPHGQASLRRGRRGPSTESPQVKGKWPPEGNFSSSATLGGQEKTRGSARVTDRTERAFPRPSTSGKQMRVTNLGEGTAWLTGEQDGSRPPPPGAMRRRKARSARTSHPHRPL